MAQFVRIDDGEESPFAIPWGTHTRDVGCQVAPVLDKPLEPPFEIGEPLQKFGLQCLNREQRNEADHGANLHRLALAIRQVQHVVEEAVLFIPHGFFTVAAVAHGIGDVEEVLPKLAGNVFVDRILAGEFERDGQHVERVHRHPRCAVGLFEDRKSTRLNSSHSSISYAVFCLKKKNRQKKDIYTLKKNKNKNENNQT